MAQQEAALDERKHEAEQPTRTPRDSQAPRATCRGTRGTRGAAKPRSPPSRPTRRLPTGRRACRHRRGRAGRDGQAPRRRRGEPPAVAASSCPPARTRSSAIYGRLDVTFDHTLGESFYQDRLGRRWSRSCCDAASPGRATGRSASSSTATTAPMIVRKKDGAFLYATTDLATIRYRMETWQPDAILYVVDHRQSAAFRAAVRRRAAAGLRRRRAAARQLRHRAGRRRPAVQDPLGRHRRPGRPAGRGRAPGAARSSPPTTTPSPTAPSFRPNERPRDRRDAWASPR